MPWTCCGTTRSDDELACPACGKSKAKWTLRLGRTRVFSLGKKDDWELEAIDHTSDSFDGEAEEEDEEWELEALDAGAADEDEEVPDGAAPPPAVSTREEDEEDEDWELEALDAGPAEEDEAVAAGGGGGAARSTREQGEDEAAEAEDDDDWELEALEQSTE